MRTLAYRGGKPIITTPIKQRDTLSLYTKKSVGNWLTYANGHDLSGYLAGSQRGGMAVQKLETIWCQTFKCDHAIACNSATSGILAALAVLEARTVHIPVMGMSAIAAAANILRAHIQFHDVDEHYCMKISPEDVAINDVILPVNLFGHPAQLREMYAIAQKRHAFLVEDNAQGMWASEYFVYAGTIGDIGVWSGNVHKPLNCGELGMLTTTDAALANELRMFINHGETADCRIGLNLRPTEMTAVMALAQMEQAHHTVAACVDIHDRLLDLSYDEFFKIAEARDGCVSSWYCLPIEAPSRVSRDFAVKALQAEGLPCRAGYVRMDKLPSFDACSLDTDGLFPLADLAQDHLILVELCSLDPTDEQIEQIAEALNAIGEEAERDRKVRRRNRKYPRGQAGELPATDPRGEEPQG